jgi:hypothetical protein
METIYDYISCRGGEEFIKTMDKRFGAKNTQEEPCKLKKSTKNRTVHFDNN